ncbi:MAG: HEAT repeat domain-containing protein [Candidatus Anstonellales archaeon]
MLKNISIENFLMKRKELERLISLTFDESPSVRKNAAIELGAIDDPAAIFALLELSYDKEPEVSQTARKILEEKRNGETTETISFAELFEAGAERPKRDTFIPSTKRKKLLEPIEKLFEKKLGKEKGERIKARMMPAIERIYDNVVEKKFDEKKVQSLLTSYLDAIGSMSESEMESIGKVEELEDIEEKVGKEEGLEESEKLTEEVKGIEPTIFRHAIDVMKESEGDENIMVREMKKLKKYINDQIDLAFNIAKNRFKRVHITHLTEIKDGMRNINTDELFVIDVQHGEYQKTKMKKDFYTRVLVRDFEGSESVVYLFEGRGQFVKPGMKIKVVKGVAKTFKFSGETALTVTKAGNVYIVL